VPFISAPNCVLVEVLGNQSGKVCEFTFGAELATGYELADLVALAGAVDGWVNTDYLPEIGSDVFYEGVTVRGLDSEEDLEYDLSEPLPGGSDVVAWPAQCAVVTTKYTGFTGRSNRGRSYLWGLNVGFQEDTRHIFEAGVTQINGWMTDLISAVIGAGWAPVVISYYHDNAPRSVAQVRPITDWNVRDTRIDTQRRRLGKT